MARQTTTTPKPDDPVQYQRFRDLAAELGADDANEKALAASVRQLAQHAPEGRRKLGKKAKGKPKR